MRILGQPFVIRPAGWRWFLLIPILGTALLISGRAKKSLPLSPVFTTDYAYDNRTFLQSVAQNQPGGTGSSPSIIILPHHLTASTVIAKGISLLTLSPPHTIVILSPNHANTGQCDIVSSKNSWDTPYGQIAIDLTQLERFVRSGTVCLDSEALAPEHGVAGLIPFVSYYLPRARIVPFALKKNINPVLLDGFIRQLTSTSSDTVFLISLDFSHGLTRELAAQRDGETLGLMRDFNYTAIEKLSSEHLDSPASLISALKLLQARSLKPEVLIHTDSSAFNSITNLVTSYFLITSHTVNSQSSITNVVPSQTDIRELKPKNDTITLLFGGDVMLGRSVNTRMIKYGDFSWPFRKISGLLSAADITFVNLESPFGLDCQPTDTGMIFCADPRSVDSLVLAGIDIVSLANNHIGNQGQVGFDETLKVLKEKNIFSVGTNLESSVILESKGIRIAYVAFNDIPPYFSEVSPARQDIITSRITQVRSQADIVVASFHWGNEYRQRSSRQVELAHLAVDSGADVVIGHHPHWVQETETYLGKPIYYSLGNLVFDQMWSEETRKGLVVKLVYSGQTLVNEEQIPIKIFDYGQPTRL